MGLTYEMPAEGMLRAVGTNIVGQLGMRLVLEVLTACECVMVFSLVMNAVVVPMAMHSVFDMVDAKMWVSAGCGTVLMGEWLALLKNF